MGGCATKPATLESEEAPTPVEAPAPLDAPTLVATNKADTVPQENGNGSDTKKEEPLVDVSEQTVDAPHDSMEVTTIATEARLVTDETNSTESKPKELEIEAKEVQETKTPIETKDGAPKYEEVKSQ